MTTKQKILRAIYPLFMGLNRFKKKNGALSNIDDIKPAISFHSLRATLSNGQPFEFSSLKGKKVLLVNVASDCGYTPQYDELEKLNTQHKEKLVVLGFPANDFKGQEPGSDVEIDNFCRKEYAVTFPIFSKLPVLPPGQQAVFQWLSDKKLNGWNDQPPTWNFSKYLVDENGKLLAFFPPAVSPLGKEVVSAIR